MTQQYPKYRERPGDLELLETVWTYEKATARLHAHAMRLKRLRQTDRFGVRLGEQWGEWEIILTDDELKKDQERKRKERVSGKRE